MRSLACARNIATFVVGEADRHQRGKRPRPCIDDILCNIAHSRRGESPGRTGSAVKTLSLVLPGCITMARHSWSDNDRIILALIYRLYENNKTDILRCWNSINRNILLSEGFQGGSMSVTALMTQRYELKRSKHPVWTRVWNTPLQLLRKRYQVQKDRIEDAAQALQIKLELRVEPREPREPTSTAANSVQAVTMPSTSISSTSGVVGRDAWSPSTEPDMPNITPGSRPLALQQTNRDLIRSYQYQPSDVVADSMEIDIQSRNEQPATDEPSVTLGSLRFAGVHVPKAAQPGFRLPQTPPAERDPLRNVRLSPKLFSTFDSEGSHSKRHPVLLCRAYDPALGFTSRHHQNRSSIEPPPALDSDAFKAVVTRHLFVDTDFESPFLSLSQFARYTLRIISRVQEPRNFAVFLYSDLEEEGRKQNKIKPRLVPRICDQHGLDHLPNKYRGRGEFIVWGRIDSKPVLNLDTRSALELFSILKDMEECTPEAAEQLLPYLSDVDLEYREVVLRALVTSLKVPGHDWNYHSARWEEFADVFFPETSQNETHDRRAESVFSTISVHHTPSLHGEGYLLVDAASDEEDNVDIFATEEYAERTAAQSRVQLDNPFMARDIGSPQEIDEQQLAVEAQLLSGIQDYLSDDVLDAVEANSSEPTADATSPDDNHDDEHNAGTVALLNATLQPSEPVPSTETRGTGSSSNLSSSPVIDLTDDSNPMPDVEQTRPIDDIDMFQISDDEDDDCVVVTPPNRPDRHMRRALSIRSRSRIDIQETPSRAPRWPEFHVTVLSDSD